MIDRLAAIVVEVADVGAARAQLAAVLGAAASDAGAGRARLPLGNMALGLAPRNTALGAGATDAVPPPMELVLATADLDATVRRLGRRGLPPAAGVRSDGSVLLDTAATRGVAIALADARGHPMHPATPDADIAGLDHVVVRTPDPERAVALYGGRLGMDLRLDRVNERHASRMLFFVVGGLVVEVVHDLRKGVGPGRDRIFGLAWRARDIERARGRMRAAGVDVSEVREGRRPGTRVMTVKSHTCSVPTLVIAGEGLERT